MQSPRLNIWLSKYCDFEFVASQDKSDSNLIIHRNILAKAADFKSVLGPYDFSTTEKFISYANLKTLWESDYRQSVSDIFKESLIGSNLSPIYASTLERFFYPCLYGCLDALFFGSSVSKNNRVPANVIITIGGDYKLEELLALIWWLAAIHVSFQGQLIEYVYLSEDAKAVRFANIYDLLKKLTKVNQLSPNITGSIPNGMVDGSVKTLVWWTSALKFPYGWSDLIRNEYDENFVPLRIAEVDFFDDYPMPCVGLSVGKSLTETQINEIFNLSVELISGINFDSEDFDREVLSYKKIITHFVKASVSVVAVEKLSSTVRLINQKFDGMNVVGACTVAAPFLESIAINEWLGRRGIKPIMLPHSFTSSHEYPPAAYSKALTFIKSSNIMMSVNDFSGTDEAEDLVSFSEIESRHINSLKSKKTRRRFLDCFDFSFSQLLFFFLSKIRAKIFNQLISFKFKKLQKKNAFKLGFLLNVEHSQFSAIVNFNEQYAALGNLLKSALIHDKSSVLIIRHKPGWTSPELIFKCINRKYFSMEKISLSPNGVSLLHFGKSCDCVLFSYATSAVLELMLQGVPTVKVLMPGLVMTEGQYIEIPLSIVPEMSVEELIRKSKLDQAWLCNLGRIQSEWVKRKMF